MEEILTWLVEFECEQYPCGYIPSIPRPVWRSLKSLEIFLYINKKQRDKND